jgi:hypothetical protein
MQATRNLCCYACDRHSLTTILPVPSTFLLLYLLFLQGAIC